MFYSCFVLSFDACLVTITWSLLFVVIALWLSVRLGRLLLLLVDRVVYRHWYVSSADEKTFGFTRERGVWV
jgi:hypothetical protein